MTRDPVAACTETPVTAARVAEKDRVRPFTANPLDVDPAGKRRGAPMTFVCHVPGEQPDHSVIAQRPRCAAHHRHRQGTRTGWPGRPVGHHVPADRVQRPRLVQVHHPFGPGLPAHPTGMVVPVSYTHLTLPTKRIV